MVGGYLSHPSHPSLGQVVRSERPETDTHTHRVSPFRGDCVCVAVSGSRTASVCLQVGEALNDLKKPTARPRRKPKRGKEKNE